MNQSTRAAIGLTVASLAAAFVFGISYLLMDTNARATARQQAAQAATRSHLATGPSGLPLPRFASVKGPRAPVRSGPSARYPLAWAYQAGGLPVEVLAEFEQWRRIRDADGDEGWIRSDRLSGWRTAMIPSSARPLPLRPRPDSSGSPLALLAPGVIVRILSCTGTWCRIHVDSYEGWVPQGALWGVYANEVYPDRTAMR